jgi:hypothetical protein
MVSKKDKSLLKITSMDTYKCKLGGKERELGPVKLKHVAEFEKEFGRERSMFMCESDGVVPNASEICFIIWACTFGREGAFEDVDEVMDLDTNEIISVTPKALSFFIGLDAEMLTTTGSSDTEG